MFGPAAAELHYSVEHVEAAAEEVHRDCAVRILEGHLFGLCLLSSPEVDDKSPYNVRSTDEIRNICFHSLCLSGLYTVGVS